MKYAFSTLGCPSWDFHDLVCTAKDLGYDGVEIRGIASELFAPKIKAFLPKNIDQSLATLGRLEIPMLTSNACIADKENRSKAYLEAISYIELASRIGARYVRLLCTNTAELDPSGDMDTALKQYADIANYAKLFKVTPLIETNGMFCDTRLLAEFMAKVDSTNIGVLWDIHHPYRYGGESVATTIANIGKYIKYVHIKDSVILDGKTVYKMLGHGDLPITDAIAALKAIGYDGYLSLEWVKRWKPDLEEPGIVFAHYIDKIKKLTK